MKKSLKYRVYRKAGDLDAAEFVAEFAEKTHAADFFTTIASANPNETYFVDTANDGDPSGPEKQNLAKLFHERLAQYERLLNEFGFSINRSMVAKEAEASFDISLTSTSVNRMFDINAKGSPGIDKVMAVCAILDIPIESIASVKKPGNNDKKFSRKLKPINPSEDDKAPGDKASENFISIIDDKNIIGNYEIFYFRPQLSLTEGELGKKSEQNAAQIISGKLTIGADGSARLDEMQGRGTSEYKRKFSGVAISMCQGDVIVVNLHGEDDETDFMTLCFKHLKLAGGNLLFVMASMTTSSGSSSGHVPVQQNAAIFRVANQTSGIDVAQIDEIVRPLLSIGCRRIAISRSELEEMRSSFPNLSQCFKVKPSPVVFVDPSDILGAKECTANNDERVKAILKLISFDKGRTMNNVSDVPIAIAAYIRSIMIKNFKRDNGKR